MNMNALESIIINPKIAARASVIWMHGLGADGYDFVDIVPQLNLPQRLGVRFIFPHAPLRSVSRAGGCSMRAWFDIDVDINASQDERGIINSQNLIEKIIKQELSKGISSRNIVLAGFSQGGALAIHCGLRYPESLAGILSLSGFLLLGDKLMSERSLANQNIPMLMIHGKKDELVPLFLAQDNYKHLTKLGFNVELKLYDMEHTVCTAEIDFIAKWLSTVLDN